MVDSTVRVRMMLQSYEQQLLAARRLIRHRANTRIAAGLNPNDPDPDPKRRELVERVAREVYQSLLYTGSDNPIIEEIRTELSLLLGTPVQFTYPPGKRLRIVKSGPDGSVALSEEEKHMVRSSLWRITREKINTSMLEKLKNEFGFGEE